MTVRPVEKSVWKVKGVPDYYKIYANLWRRYIKTGCLESKTLAYHYARVAAEMGQVIIDDYDDQTDEITLI